MPQAHPLYILVGHVVRCKGSGAPGLGMKTQAWLDVAANFPAVQVCAAQVCAARQGGIVRPPTCVATLHCRWHLKKRSKFGGLWGLICWFAGIHTSAHLTRPLPRTQLAGELAASLFPMPVTRAGV
eukprot:366207-Chlamydomonas_euryale.AAC.6